VSVSRLSTFLQKLFDFLQQRREGKQTGGKYLATSHCVPPPRLPLERASFSQEQNQRSKKTEREKSLALE